jgi:hypothetical protein
MKTFLMILGVLFLILVAGVVAIFVWAGTSGENTQEAFFKAVGSGDTQQVMAMFHPSLRDEVDAPVLAAWMEAFNARLGAFEGLSKTDFNHSSEYVNGVKVVKSSGTVRFAKGEAKSELVLQDDKVIGFDVSSPALESGWFRGPADIDMYKQNGRQFLQFFLDADIDKAYAMVHPALQEAVPHDQFEAMVAKVTGSAGPVQSIEYKKHTLETNGDKTVLRIFYNVECSNSSTVAAVEFQFQGLKGHLTAFDLTGGK